MYTRACSVLRHSCVVRAIIRSEKGLSEIKDDVRNHYETPSAVCGFVGKSNYARRNGC